MTATRTVSEQSAVFAPVVSVIVPARNEQDCLGACLESLVGQTGVAFEIIVVDDHSTDGTREIAAPFPAVKVIEAGPLPAGWTGKNNAVTCGARQARGEWLLFTDADTVHPPGSLTRALAEAKEHGADLLSYSPEQVAVSFWEMATLPVIFAELARQYPPAKVSDPASPIAAANGQFILIRREAYEAVGGHAAIAGEILEDVALARAVKSSRRKIRFRYAGDAVRTRMYRSFRQLREGWTKNLALLFPNPGQLAVKTLLFWGITWGALSLVLITRGKYWPWHTMFACGIVFLTTRISRANFTSDMTLLGALFGMPMFTYLLLRSKRAHATGRVGWKGRTYSDKRRSDQSGVLATGNWPLTTGNWFSMVYLTRKAEFSASHYYHNPEFTPEENQRVFGKCNNPNGHGHNYTLEVTVTGEVDPRSGFVVDLKQLKEVMHREVLDAMDHRFLNKEVPEFFTRVPTTENLAITIWQRLESKLQRARLHRVRVYETPDLFVDFYGEA